MLKEKETTNRFNSALNKCQGFFIVFCLAVIIGALILVAIVMYVYVELLNALTDALFK
jgi:hypothetical protein